MKAITRKEYLKLNRIKPEFGFCWIHPEHRSSEAEAKKDLKKDPTIAVNLGDGKGWRYGKKFKGEKIDDVSLTKPKKKIKKKRGKSINISGLTFEKKKKQISKLIKEKYGKVIPEGVKFNASVIRSGKSNDNPDGLRLLVYVDGLKAQTNFDYKGKFRIDALFRCIDEHCEV